MRFRMALVGTILVGTGFAQNVVKYQGTVDNVKYVYASRRLSPV